MQTLSKLVLRHEDTVNMMKVEVAFVAFMQNGIPTSIVPPLFRASMAWQQMRKQSPDGPQRPTRVELMLCVFQELKLRLRKLQDDPASVNELEKLGWAKDQAWLPLKRSAELGRHIPDDSSDAKPLPFQNGGLSFSSSRPQMQCNDSTPLAV